MKDESNENNKSHAVSALHSQHVVLVHSPQLAGATVSIVDILKVFRGKGRLFLVLLLICCAIMGYLAYCKTKQVQYSQLVSLPTTYKPANDNVIYTTIITPTQLSQEFHSLYYLPWVAQGKPLVNETFLFDNVLSPQTPSSDAVLSPNATIMLRVTAAKSQEPLVRKLFADSVEGFQAIANTDIAAWRQGVQADIDQDTIKYHELQQTLVQMQHGFAGGSGGLTEAQIMLVAQTQINMVDIKQTLEQNKYMLKHSVTKVGVLSPVSMQQDAGSLRSVMLYLFLAFVSAFILTAIIGAISAIFDFWSKQH